MSPCKKCDASSHTSPMRRASGFAALTAARKARRKPSLISLEMCIRDSTEMVAYVRSVLEDVVREQDERIRHSTDRLESLLVDLHNHMLLDAPYGGRCV